MVVNTHWHADHVGGNAALQATVDQALDDQQRLQLGEAEWQVVATPGHAAAEHAPVEAAALDLRPKGFEPLTF